MKKVQKRAAERGWKELIKEILSELKCKGLWGFVRGKKSGEQKEGGWLPREFRSSPAIRRGKALREIGLHRTARTRPFNALEV